MADFGREADVTETGPVLDWQLLTPEVRKLTFAS